MKQILPTLILLFCCTHLNAVGQMPDTDSLISYVAGESRKGNFHAVDSIARELRMLGERNNDRRASLYGLIYTGHSLARERNDSVAVYYGRALELAAELEDYGALAATNNALAIYTSEIEMNFLRGFSYFMDALKYAELIPDKYSYHLILSNIAMAYYLRNDAGGLKYSLEVIEAGKANNEPMLIYSGSFVTAYMYYLLGDYPAALKYIEDAIATGGNSVEFVEAYSLYANILAKLGREREAVRYYRLSLEYVGEEKSNTLAYINYGNYLIEKGQYREAADILEKGLDFVNKRNNAFYRYQLYEKLSLALELAGATHDALDYYKMYHHDADSIFNVERERAINELRAQYEYEKQEKEIQEKELALLHESHKLNVTIFLVVMIVGISFGVIIYYRRKNQRYKQIVRQQLELINREKQIEKLSGSSNIAGQEKYTVSSLSEEKGLTLFAEFERLVKSEKIYRERNITIEKVAKMLDTNRSYLSRVINETGGISSPQYTPPRRIDEARRILSEPDNDIQIKTIAYDLGFATFRTFSSSFRDSIGMLPSKFRDEMRKMRR